MQSAKSYETNRSNWTGCSTVEAGTLQNAINYCKAFNILTMAGDKTYDQNGNLTAFPNLILVQNEPPLVPLWVPNAASESLEKKRTSVAICFAHLGPEQLVTPRLFPI